VKNGSTRKIAIFNLNEGMIIHNIDIIVDKKFYKIFNKCIDEFDFDSNKSNITIKKNKKIKKGDNEKSSENQLKYNLSSSTVAGLSAYDISFIKKLFKLKFINETIKTKIGIPFAPSIAIGLIIAIFIGDLSILLFDVLNNLLNYLHFF
jgi:preflagellin peptidase FlaK